MHIAQLSGALEGIFLLPGPVLAHRLDLEQVLQHCLL